MEDNLSFWRFWGTILLDSIKSIYGLVSAVGLVIWIVFGIISSEHPSWGGLLNTLGLAIAIGVIVLAFIPSVMIQAHFFYKQKADKVQEFETEAIEVTGGCLFLSREGVWAARVGINALGRKVVKGVTAYLVAIDGNENNLRDAPLSPSGRLPNLTGAINVNPGNVQRFIEILHWKPDIEMGIPYNLNYQLQYAGINIQQSPYSLPTVIPIVTFPRV